MKATDVMDPAKEPKRSEEEKNAENFTGSALPAALVVTAYSAAGTDGFSVVKALNAKSTALSTGDMDQVEKMLLHQAVALQSMFMDLAVRAKRQQEIPALQVLSQLALKAQSGSRATLQTLAEIKNPRPMFVRQTNVAQNQQVNNGEPSSSRAKKLRKAPIELKAHTENAHGYPTLDPRAAATASPSDSPEPAVGAVDWTSNDRG